MSQRIEQILSYYGADNPGTKTNLARVLNHGHLQGTGKMIIYPVDQGMEHGPVRSFGMNPDAYDPLYHFQLAVESGVSAFAAPLGLLECGASPYAGKIPLILKVNSNNTLSKINNQAITSHVEDALRLGCVGIGFTIYPGSDHALSMFEQCKDMIAKAKRFGLFSVIWSYPRGNLSKEGETALDVVSYGAHMAALLGAHIIKVKMPSAHLVAASDVFPTPSVNVQRGKDRIAHVVKSCFEGKRVVVFSGGDTKSEEALLQDIQNVRDGGGFGSIMGRNCFQRPKNEALSLIQKIISIYQGI